MPYIPVIISIIVSAACDAREWEFIPDVLTHCQLQ